MRALNAVHYMTRRRIIDHHTAYSETKCGVKAPTQNRTNNSPNEHYAVDGNRNNDGQLARLSGRGYAVDGNRNNDGQLARLSGRGYAVDGNRNNDGQLARLSGRVDVDGNRNGSESEPAWRAQTACFGAFDGSAPCVAHQEDRRYADDRW